MDQNDFTEQGAASLLGVDPRTLRRWRNSGAVGYSRTPGGRVRYSMEDLRRLKNGMRVAPTCDPT